MKNRDNRQMRDSNGPQRRQKFDYYYADLYDEYGDYNNYYDTNSGTGSQNRRGSHGSDDHSNSRLYGSPSGYTSTYYECDDGISIGLLVISALGIAVMWYILYTKIVGGRRKRSYHSDNILWFIQHTEEIIINGSEVRTRSLHILSFSFINFTWVSMAGQNCGETRACFYFSSFLRLFHFLF